MSEGYTDVPTCPMSGGKAPAACPAGIREVLSMVGDKWSMLVVGMLRDSPMRFNGLRRVIDGISQRMLTRTLRELERSGLVSRTVTPTTPPSVEYALTELGKTLLDPIKTLIAWTQHNYPAMTKAQQRYDKTNPAK